MTLLQVFYLVLLLCLAGFNCENESTSISERIALGVQEIFNTSEIPSQMKDVYSELQAINNTELKNREYCRACELSVEETIKYRRSGASNSAFKSSMTLMCMLFMGMDRLSSEQFVEIESETILFMLDNKHDISGERVCSIYFQHLGCKDSNRKIWKVEVPPAINEPTNEKVSEVSEQNSQEPIKVLHLTDVHYDPLYQPGSNAKCTFNLCCQNSSGTPATLEAAAGYWGDYNICDIPWHTITNALTHIKDQHKQIDQIYYTGDIVSHRSWDTSIKKNEDAIEMLYEELAKTFHGIKVYPILGNHESNPSNVWVDLDDSYSISTQWVFDFVAKVWSNWLPESSLDTIRKGGYYTVLVKPGFRIIALNSNVCLTYNFWLFYADVDPYGQLQWLANTLEEAEKNNELVHLLSHVPPGDVECLENWSDEFNKIVKRFSRVIKAQFNGHTHLDELRLFYNDDNSKVINVAYNGGSLTTNVGLNPNYRIYDVDSVNYLVSDYEEWYYNMTEANLVADKQPDWNKLYSFKDAYGLSSMSLDSLGELVEDMQNNITLQQQYFRFEMRDSDASKWKGCNADCLKAHVCSIKAYNFFDGLKCGHRILA